MCSPVGDDAVLPPDDASSAAFLPVGDAYVLHLQDAALLPGVPSSPIPSSVVHDPIHADVILQLTKVYFKAFPPPAVVAVTYVSSTSSDF